MYEEATNQLRKVLLLRLCEFDILDLLLAVDVRICNFQFPSQKFPRSLNLSPPLEMVVQGDTGGRKPWFG